MVFLPSKADVTAGLGSLGMTTSEGVGGRLQEVRGTHLICPLLSFTSTSQNLLRASSLLVIYRSEQMTTSLVT